MSNLVHILPAVTRVNIETPTHDHATPFCHAHHIVFTLPGFVGNIYEKNLVQIPLVVERVNIATPTHPNVTPTCHTNNIAYNFPGGVGNLYAKFGLDLSCA